MGLRFLPKEEFIGDMREEYKETLRVLKICLKKASGKNALKNVADKGIISDMIYSVGEQSNLAMTYYERREVGCEKKTNFVKGNRL